MGDTQEPLKLKQAIKNIIPGFTTVVLSNGDVVIMQIAVKDVYLIVGQKDANGNRVYTVEHGTGMGVAPPHKEST